MTHVSPTVTPAVHDGSLKALIDGYTASTIGKVTGRDGDAVTVTAHWSDTDGASVGINGDLLPTSAVGRLIALLTDAAAAADRYEPEVAL